MGRPFSFMGYVKPSMPAQPWAQPGGRRFQVRRFTPPKAMTGAMLSRAKLAKWMGPKGR